MKKLIAQLAYSYVKAVKTVSYIREGDFIAFYFDHLKPFFDKSISINEEPVSVAERIKEIQKLIADNADAIAQKVIREHKTVLKKNLARALKMNEKVHMLEKKIEQLNTADMNELVEGIIKNEIKIFGKINNELWKKLNSEISPNSIPL